MQDSSTQQAFINQMVPGALATQRRYGIPAAVTIAQAIDESGWGQSTLAVQAHNLFGIKGTGPAGSDPMPTQEYENGQWVTTNAPFRAYHNFAESIDDHGELLATSGYYTQAMSDRNDPNAFANALTGVYATNPQYGSDLIQLMQQYDLYRYDSTQAPTIHNGPAQSAGAAARAKPSGTTAPATSGAPGVTTPSRPRPVSTSSPRPAGRPSPEPTGSSPQPASTSSPQPASGQAGSSQAASTGGAADVPGAPAPRSTTAPRRTRPADPADNSPAAPRPDPVVIPGPTGESAAYQILPTGMSTTLTASVRPAPRQSAAPRQEPVPRQSAAPRQEPVPRQSAAPRQEPVPRQSATPRQEPAAAAAQRPVQRPARRPYRMQLPTPVKNAFVASAKVPLLHEELLYRDVASSLGLSWELLAACDWMQCAARPRLSPVHGEKLGTRNPDGTVYHTRSEALEECATDLVALAGTVYGIDLTTAVNLSIGDLARVFAAFRWGALLKQHHTSAMEFPYSVAGLTVQHLSMRWPAIAARAPDEPGKRFRKPFGAVPVVLSLNYPATV